MSLPDSSAPSRASSNVVSLEPSPFARHLEPAMRCQLKAIFAHWNDSAGAEALLREIIDAAPDTLGVRIVAYRFYFYRRRSREAAHWALACLDWLSTRLGLPADWREVHPGMADFAPWHAYARCWLQALTAYAYHLARLGEEETALAVLAKVEQLDPGRRLGAARLRWVFAGPRGDAGGGFEMAWENWRSPATWNARQA